MKILVLMDSFKGSLTSIEAGEAVKTGILSSGSDADVSVYPFADGGEGRMDEQTAMGKAPVRIANLAKKYDKPVIAITGCVGKGAEICHDAGIDAIFPTLSHPMTSDITSIKYITR